MSRIAVFGGGGFIGSHLCRRLVADHELDILDIDLQKIQDLDSHPDTTFHEVDIRDSATDSLSKNLIDRSDIVIDLIAYANPKQYVDMPLEVVNLNYDMNLKLVEQCSMSGTRLIQFSTCEVYGKVGAREGENVVFNEESSNLVMGPVGNHRWIYATAKQLLERMVNAHGIEKGLSWTIIRPFNFIGPEMDYIIESPDEGTPRVFAAFMSSLLFDHPMFLVDGGTNKRSFTYIQDAIDAIELIVKNRRDFENEVVNIGTPANETSIRGFAHLMRDTYQDLSLDGTLPELREVPGEEYYGEGYEDIERRVPDISKLTAVGWEPQYDLEQSVRETVQYYIDTYERQEYSKPDV